MIIMGEVLRREISVRIGGIRPLNAVRADTCPSGANLGAKKESPAGRPDDVEPR